jgi:dihydrofolate reductase
MVISLVVAAASNHVIGKGGIMPWHLPNDLRHFKNVTWGMPVVMGRKTFDSLGKPLTGRKNIVITRQDDWKADGAIAVKNLEDALFLVKETDAKEAMIIGGGEIFKMVFSKANRIYMTRVEAEPEGDTYFPEIHPHQWRLVSQKNYEADEKNPFNHSFQLWERK